MKQLIVILLALLSMVVEHGNAAVAAADSAESVIFEKVYLHVDRELYTAGDEVWFKSYLINGLNNRIIPGYKNIYVQLVSESGNILYNHLLLSQDGFASGDFKLQETLKEGIYFIRAYTRYQTNFSEDGYFYKKIFVAEPKNSLDLIPQAYKSKSQQIDVSFLPEGGILVLGADNTIAFKAINEKGKGISVKGKIVDNTGNEVTSFESIYKGMGKFVMTPEEGKSYSAHIEGYPDFTYTFEAAKPDAVTINYEPGERQLFVILKRNPDSFGDQDLILQATHKGIVLFNTQITLDEEEIETILMKQLFPTGISKIILTDLQGNIVSERLIFVEDNKKESIEIKLNKAEFAQREKVELEISTLLPGNDVVDSTLSVAVVNENYFGLSEISQTIQSYLLLDSELKGHIESPASSFIDEENISSEEKLDLVMLVNGWRSYYWDELDSHHGEKLSGWDDLGLTFRGKVTRTEGNKPVPGADVLLSPYAGGLQVRKQTTDDEGNFSFDGMFFKDSAMIILDAVTNGGNRNLEIDFEQASFLNTNVNISNLHNYQEMNVPLLFKQGEYERFTTEKEYKLKTDDILISEVQVTGKRTISDGHYRIYGEPDVSFEISDADQNYLSVLDYLENRVAGVVITTDNRGGSVRIRGAKSDPLLVIDGVPFIPSDVNSWSDQIAAISINDVDKIEILKSGFGAAAFGSRGADGVLSIFTKVNKKHVPSVLDVPGRINPVISGYCQPRQFYSPKYTPENIKTERPDFRPTLIWIPNLTLKDANSKIEFYTSDESGKYQIIVEGISQKGKICFGTGILNVAAAQ
jgi:hypothetical protein